MPSRELKDPALLGLLPSCTFLCLSLDCSLDSLQHSTMSYTNRFPPTQNTRYRSSWGPSSVSAFARAADVPRPSPEEEEFAEFYNERLHSAQSRQLIPLQEDLADWINKTISESLFYFYISASINVSLYAVQHHDGACFQTRYQTAHVLILLHVFIIFSIPFFYHVEYLNFANFIFSEESMEFLF